MPPESSGMTMMRMFVQELPSCDRRYMRDICMETGRAAFDLLGGYPTAHVERIAKNAEHLNLARTLIEEIRPKSVYPCLTHRQLSVTSPFTTMEVEVEVVVGTITFEFLAVDATRAGTNSLDALQAAYHQARNIFVLASTSFTLDRTTF
ncbi:hypothetical protein PHYSODRAFT_300607 [Phytophthora sojae]|uniref:Uncharacterized protein n=1 Tax=Phytophthora sojae (strain P6497) TaxID=1094619 RepID=G4ZGT3_PHYSP|nr:hypothetical protein PHYSODRAFT_300607 [Phytophthora sojae]EGZ17582.1 hypothetical protein PHYSODRAFT_300607 [Phytophthora sojae]|eukprot:XP_009526640.1 hypothetical protein PHYSODRAFT_300607 [Phytophthora sojae]